VTFTCTSVEEIGVEFAVLVPDDADSVSQVWVELDRPGTPVVCAAVAVQFMVPEPVLRMWMVWDGRIPLPVVAVNAGSGDWSTRIVALPVVWACNSQENAST
jgi:hypothetical protein